MLRLRSLAAGLAALFFGADAAADESIPGPAADPSWTAPNVADMAKRAYGGGMSKKLYTAPDIAWTDWTAVRRAAVKGDAEAELLLSFYYEQMALDVCRLTQTVDPDVLTLCPPLAKSVDWRRRAGERGHPLAALELSMRQQMGHLVPQDRGAAYYWFVRGVDAYALAVEAGKAPRDDDRLETGPKIAEANRERLTAEELTRADALIAEWRAGGRAIPDAPAP